MKIVAVLYSGAEHATEQPKLLGTIENQLGLRQWLEGLGHTFVVTDDKEPPNSTLDRELPDTDILITTPFHPAYVSAERIAKAPKLKLCVTAGVGSDHIDLEAANKAKITVTEVTGSNVVSVAEHVVMNILLLVRNFVPAHEQIVRGDWNVAAVAKNAYDLEHKVVGTVGCGRIGYRVLQRLVPFDCKLVYFDYQPLREDLAQAVKAERVNTIEELLARCDVVTINTPLHEGTKGLFNKELLYKMKKGAFLVNTARGAIVNQDDLAEAIKSGHLGGYAGDVWYPQPAPADHPWRTMERPGGGGNGMVAHYSGTTLDAQQRYASGVKDIIDRFLHGKEQDSVNVIVSNGVYVSPSYGQRK